MLRFLQVLLGLMFLASGLAKAVTPLFSAAKLDEYLLIAGLDWLVVVDLPLMMLIDAVEVSLGVMLIFNIRPRVALWVSTLLMIVFTPKTLYVAIESLMDYSGCFGGLLPITPWQSHWKNVFMDVIIVLLWLGRRELFKRSVARARDWIIVFGVFIGVILLQLLLIL